MPAHESLGSIPNHLSSAQDTPMCRVFSDSASASHNSLHRIIDPVAQASTSESVLSFIRHGGVSLCGSKGIPHLETPSPSLDVRATMVTQISHRLFERLVQRWPPTATRSTRGPLSHSPVTSSTADHDGRERVHTESRDSSIPASGPPGFPRAGESTQTDFLQPRYGNSRPKPQALAIQFCVENVGEFNRSLGA